MKFFLLLLLTSSISYSEYGSDELSKMRKLFEMVDTSESYNTQLYKLVKNAELSDAEAYGYLAFHYFMNAKYKFWVNTKMDNFKTGKSMLESIIIKHPNNPDLRLIRYSIQYNIPAFLGYNDNILVDKAFIKKIKDSTKDKELKRLITGILNSYP
jgi:hypothetical protein